MSKHAPVKPTPKHEPKHEKPTSPGRPTKAPEVVEANRKTMELADVARDTHLEETSEAIAKDLHAAVDRAEDGPPLLDSAAKDDLEPIADPELHDLMALQAKADAEAAAKPKPKKAIYAPARVLVHNTTGHLYTVALFAEVDPKRPVASSKTFVLPPGVTPVPADVWARTTGKELSVQRLISAGHLVELGAKSLGELREKAALELVSLVVDRPILLEWAEGEKREVVRAALVGQVEKIAPSKRPEEKKPRDEDEDEDQE